MARDSRKRKANKKDKRIAWELARVEESTKLPKKVALPEHLHSLNYQLNFEQYKHGDCELHTLDEGSAKALVKKMSLLAQSNNRNIGSSKLIRDNVSNSGPYKHLYKGLGSDVELKEIQFSGTGRIFCHFVNDYPDSDDSGRTSNYCCVVAIKTEHIDIY